MTPVPTHPAPAAQLNGVAHVLRARLDAKPRRSRLWPGMIFALIGLNMAIVAVTVYFATSDRSVATEPDYYAKALNYDAEIALRESSRALGWTADAALRPAADGGGMELTIALADREGRSVEGAEVSAVTFANVRSGDRQKVTLARDTATGVYAAPVRIDRPGVWRVRVLAIRGDQNFARETDIFVPAP